jgi:Uncharacterized alpha/beta hydrolase domain (DUF2235)
VPRKFALFFDGTGASAASTQRETNVFRINRSLNYPAKTSFYFAGVGTRRDYVSLASGAGLDEIIREAYVNLASNYQPGDELYLFGWSRGAVAARALAAMLSRPGLIMCDGLNHYPNVWKYFCLDKTSLPNRKMAAALWRTFQNDLVPDQQAPQIKFLGIFDSVMGTYWSLLRQKFLKLQFETLTLDARIEYAFQLLSIDDNRNPAYKPLLWTDKTHDKQSFDQVWMPGVHADLGGNSGAVFLNNVAFLTMIGVARARSSFEPGDWDQERIDEAIRELNLDPPFPVEVSSERGNIWNPNRILLWGKRSIGDPTYQSQSLHPIVDVLLGQHVIMRGRKTRYVPRNVARDALRLPRFHVPDYHELICTAAKHAVGTPGLRDKEKEPPLCAPPGSGERRNPSVPEVSLKVGDHTSHTPTQSLQDERTNHNQRGGDF